MKKVLVIVAHPDDEVVGCGGVIARFAREGNRIYTMILGEGITSRDEKRDIKKRENELRRLKGSVHKANRLLGVRDVFTYDFPDNRFDSVELLDMVKIIEKIIMKIKPDTILTHYEKDLNIDHRITCQAVIAATRPFAGQTVKEIYSFEVLSSTEWNFPLSFSPDVFFDIKETLNKKLKAMSEYKTELKKMPHPRSLKGIEINAMQWGMKTGLEYAEAFKTIRCIK